MGGVYIRSRLQTTVVFGRTLYARLTMLSTTLFLPPHPRTPAAGRRDSEPSSAASFTRSLGHPFATNNDLAPRLLQTVRSGHVCGAGPATVFYRLQPRLPRGY